MSTLQKRLDEPQKPYMTRGDYIRAFLLAGGGKFINEATKEPIDDVREAYNINITFDGGVCNGFTIPQGTQVQCSGEEFLYVKSLMKLRGEI